MGQGAGPDASAFQRGEWGELGELEGGAVLSIAQARYRQGSVVTFALRTQYPAGETATTLDVIELDCATARFRRVSARETAATARCARATRRARSRRSRRGA